ncbi:MAG: PhoD-like phosphatase N-terminal domain-containing protein [Microthrixaceae bacterium]
MERRTLLRGTLMGAGGLAAAHVLGCAPPPGPHVDLGPFDCGVASGVHGPGSTVLWTRFAPASTAATELRWLVATDQGMSTVVAAGIVVAEPDTDGCAKVLVDGLEPGATYWYRFEVDGVSSPVGRTRTLPDPDTQLSSVRLGVASCQNYGAGFYAAWRALAQADLDAVVFLGDYIYESDSTSPLDVRLDPVQATDLEGVPGQVPPVPLRSGPPRRSRRPPVRPDLGRPRDRERLQPDDPARGAGPCRGGVSRLVRVPACDAHRR